MQHGHFKCLCFICMTNQYSCYMTEQIIKDAGTPEQHRIALSAMMISWLKTEENYLQRQELKDKVIGTYNALDAALSRME